MNALEEQTLAPDRWELIVVHDSRGPATHELLESHPLRERVSVRHTRLEPHTGPPAAVVYHAVESSTLIGALRRSIRWQHLAYVVKRHPHVRERLELRVFWRRSHALFALALGGGAAMRLARPAGALAVPYLAH